MICYLNKGSLLRDTRAQIIFNPVSVSKSKAGQDVFNPKIKQQYPSVYKSYREYMIGESQKRLLGDIQLIQIGEKKLILNAFVYKGNELNLKAVSKTFIELSNLIEEYNINAAFLNNLGSRNIKDIYEIEKIITTIFADCKSDIYIYKK